jgi:hypothetical protein
MPHARTATGQASVELIAVLPLAAVAGAVLWQLVLGGQAIWSSAGAARAAARAQAVGGDPLRAARAAVPGALRRSVEVRPAGGGVRVGVGVPLVLAGVRLTTIQARAELPPQR